MARGAALPALVVAMAAWGCGGVPRPSSGAPHGHAPSGARAVSIVTHAAAAPLADTPVEVDFLDRLRAR